LRHMMRKPCCNRSRYPRHDHSIRSMPGEVKRKYGKCPRISSLRNLRSLRTRFRVGAHPRSSAVSLSSESLKSVQSVDLHFEIPQTPVERPVERPPQRGVERPVECGVETGEERLPQCGVQRPVESGVKCAPQHPLERPPESGVEAAPQRPVECVPERPPQRGGDAPPQDHR
jgi:hypothetical protein